MSDLPDTIPKRARLKPAEDFYGLRREGIGYIAQTGSALWTDYNTHDPGVTILEALAYALTDLAYRTDWDIQDLLAASTPSSDPLRPFPKQPFFTAREILTVNPWTPDDFRRLLIDLDTIRNAWVFCKSCACDVQYYAWCEHNELILSYQNKSPERSLEPTSIKGFYDVLVELERDPELGDLNDRKLEHTYNVFDEQGKPHPVTLEVRFPEWSPGVREQRASFTAGDVTSVQVTLAQFSATKTYDVLSDPALDDAGRNAYVQKHWRYVLYGTFDVTLMPSGTHVTIPHAALRILGDAFAKSQGSVMALKALLEDASASGFIQRYRRKLQKVDDAVRSAKASLHAHRNLDEDYCRIAGVAVDDVAACADVEVSTDADIEWVQAKIWFEMEQYFNPPVPFCGLKDMLDAGMAVEDIFNGPQMNNGFLKPNDLEAAALRTELRTSDLLNRLMDIEGVVAVNNLLLTRYDMEGNVVKGVADPTWQDGGPVFDPQKESASWLLMVGDRHQPRLYYNLSRFLFFKNGLPFLPRKDEAYGVLVQLRGEAERSKLQGTKEDLPIPAGTFRHPEDYLPVQYSFPMTYGIGRDGLPAQASPARRGQAKQMKAYLMVFEQLLGNAFAQLANTAQLFSLDPTVEHTYFVKPFDDATIQGYGELVDAGLSGDALQGLVETDREFHERRNRFLDHVMARFGEEFREYALLLTNWQGEQVALEKLIDDKIGFVNAYPSISRGRGKAFNYKEKPCSPENVSGLKSRVSLLLGYPDLAFSWEVGTPEANQYPVDFTLAENGTVWLKGRLTVTSSSTDSAKDQAFQDVVTRMTVSDAYSIVSDNPPFRLVIKDKHGNVLGQGPPAEKKSEAVSLRDELLGWSSNERALVVEHLLLRPKFPGDALFPACTEGPCQTCGDQDPYSFRLTFVMPGWTTPFNTNLDMRGFADRTIRQETPSHLVVKTCWVGNDGFIQNPCDPVIGQLAGLLIAKGRTEDDVRPSDAEACSCALAIYKAFGSAFENWYEDKTLTYFHADGLVEKLSAEFRDRINPTEVTCTAVLNEALWADVLAIMVKHFTEIVQRGWQFERFEDAWCHWLDANAEIDWTEERLQDGVEAVLRENLHLGPDGRSPAEDELCKCAAGILLKYGMAFYEWMSANVKAGTALKDFPPFTPDPVSLCDGLSFKEGTVQLMGALLKDSYDRYTNVSYRLWIVVNLLAGLRSTYPAATLHDCDDGSDENPVRLGKTALGQYPLRQTSDASGAAPANG